jgi:hypothetical protein
MSDATKAASCQVIQAAANTVCRCGFQMEVGHALVRIDGVTIRVGLDAKSGVVWPSGVRIAPATAALWEPTVRAAWLQQVGDAWDALAPAKGAAA